MKVGQLVVLVDDVDGVEAGREGCIMGARDNMLLIGCRSARRSELILVRTRDVLPERKWRRLKKREKGWGNE